MTALNSKTPQYYLGLMSGTSADGIDLALVEFSSGKPELVASYYQAYSQKTKTQITSLYNPSANEIDRAYSLDVELAQQFASAINNFLQEQQLSANDIIAIGNHGQTIRHRPIRSQLNDQAFTVQIGCSQTLAVLTGIRVVGQFRQKDIALGGQGAPLVPAFHQVLFGASEQDTFIVNIGGISNITYLPQQAEKSVLGFDTGPGNALLDDWFSKHHQDAEQSFDENGQWAKTGNVSTALLTALLDDNYFALPAPKSTGREYFNLSWLEQHLEKFPTLKNEDVQATLINLTCASIASQITKLSSINTKANTNVYLCGGGVQNHYLVHQLKQALPDFNVASCNDINIDSDSLEAMAFAWLAYAYDQQINSNMPEVTGASKATVLGVSFSA